MTILEDFLCKIWECGIFGGTPAASASNPQKLSLRKSYFPLYGTSCSYYLKVATQMLQIVQLLHVFMKVETYIGWYLIEEYVLIFYILG